MMSNTPISLSGSDKPTMLLVLGPGRSGTSLVTRLLECLGGKNSKNLMPPNAGNPTGYFEDLDIYHFNEKILLPCLGLNWYSLSFPDWNCLTPHIRRDLEKKALEIIHKNYLLSSSSVFILKEARINMLLPFWLSVLERAEVNVKLVGVLRDPMSVAQSLKRQHGFSITHGGIWYIAMWLSALMSSKHLPAALVYFDDIFINPLKTLQLLAPQLQLPLPGDVEEQVAIFTTAHLDRKLRHFYSSQNLSPDLPLLSIKIYEILLEAAANQTMATVERMTPSLIGDLLHIQPLLKQFENTFNQYYQSFLTNY